MKHPTITVMVPLDGNPEMNNRLLKVWQSWYDLDYPKSKLKFLFALPVGCEQKDFVKEHFKLKMNFLDLTILGSDWHYQIMAGIRDALIHYAKPSDYGWCLDSDVIPPSHTIRDFLEDDVDIVGGIVKIPDNYDHFQLGFGYFGPQHYFATEIPSENLAQVGSVNTTCMFLSHKIMNDSRLSFASLVHKGEHGQLIDISEDHSFCLNANLLGYKVWVDTRVKCTHLRCWDGRIQTIKVD